MTILTNPRWEQFAQRVATGESATSAYRALYNASTKSAEAHGCRLVKSGKVSARIAELQGEAAKTCVMTIATRRELLARFAQSETERTADRIRALELDAKLAGDLKGDSMTLNATAVSAQMLTEEQKAKIMELRREGVRWDAGGILTDEERAGLMAKKQAAIARRRAAGMAS